VTYLLDQSKVAYHADRVAAWERGERIAPITIDMALNQSCQYKCGFCYMQLQKQERYERITTQVMVDFLNDCKEIGVKGVSFVSDGESTLSKAFIPSVQLGYRLGLDMAVGSNCRALIPEVAALVLPYLTYLRCNFSAGESKRYAEIMGCKEEDYHEVVKNLEAMVRYKRRHSNGQGCTLGIQMVLRPEDKDQILPFARLGKEIGVDYAVIKHCSDDEYGTLGVDYSKYDECFALLKQAEALSDSSYQVTAKWSKILTGNKRSYSRCYGPPFILQISGSGLLAPCGMLFNERYKELYHIGNICETRFKDIWRSERYWEVMARLASPDFDARYMCGTLCLQHKTNEVLDGIKNGKPLPIVSGEPEHVNFI
jgi:molybdenum cofactor biosynthesis enzyme MoaA